MQIKTTVSTTTYVLGWTLSKVQKITSFGEDVEKLSHCTLLWECKKLQPTVGNGMEVPQEIKNRTIYYVIQEFHFWAYIQKNWNQDIKEVSTLIVIAALFKIANPCPLIDGLKKMWLMCTLWYHSMLRKSCHMQHHEWTWKPYGKWNRPDTEGQISSLMRYLK